jgi:hypothetical protein
VKVNEFLANFKDLVSFVQKCRSFAKISLIFSTQALMCIPLSGDNFSIAMTGGKLAKLLETYTESLLGVKWPGAYIHTQFLGLVPSSSH